VGDGDAIEDGIGDGAVGDDGVPVLDRHLAGDDGRATLMAVVDDLEKIRAPVRRRAGRAPVVENEEFAPCEGLGQPRPVENAPFFST
jgi:hypothetical protein